MLYCGITYHEDNMAEILVRRYSTTADSLQAALQMWYNRGYELVSMAVDNYGAAICVLKKEINDA